MTLSSHFALNTAFRVKSLSMDALVLRHDCLKYTEMRIYTVSGKHVG